MRNTLQTLLMAAVLLATAPAFAQKAASAAAAKARWDRPVQNTYCTDCHNATDWAGGVAFDTLTPAELINEIKLGEHTVRKLRGHLMPPPGSKQPTHAENELLETSLELHAFANGPRGIKWSTIVQAWTRACEHVTPFFLFPPDIRRVIYTTNAIGSLNMQLRKIIKTLGHFPNAESAIKLLRLALRNVLNKTVRSLFGWKSTMNQFAILYGDRFTLAKG